MLGSFRLYLISKNLHLQFNFTRMISMTANSSFVDRAGPYLLAKEFRYILAFKNKAAIGFNIKKKAKQFFIK